MPEMECMCAAIVVPNSPSGFFTAISMKAHLNYFVFAKKDVFRTQGHQLNRVNIPEGYEAIYVGGLGLKNCNPKDLQKFIASHGERLVCWADNYPGEDMITELKGNPKYLQGQIKKHPSTTSLLAKKWGEKIVKNEWVVAANYLENKLLPKNETASDYEKLFYLAKVEDQNNQTGDFNRHLTEIYEGYLLEGTNKFQMEVLFKKHDELIISTEEALANIKELKANTFFVKSPKLIDQEKIISTIGKKSRNYNLIIQNRSLTNEPVTIVTTSNIGLSPFSDLISKNKESERILIKSPEILEKIEERIASL